MFPQVTLGNLDRIATLPANQQKAALAGFVRANLKLPALVIGMLGAKAAAIARHDASKSFGLAKPELPSIDSIKAYLTSDRAAPILGQKWAVPADNPELTGVANAMDQFFHELPALDLGYQSLFDFIDMRQSKEETFDLISSNLGITWAAIDAAGNLKPNRRFTEGATPIRRLTYGAALGIQDDWLRFNKFYLVADAVREFQARYWALHANSHYGLFSALGAGVNTAFATDDQNTLNTAGATIARAMEAKGFSGGNLQFTILTSPERVGRILQMLEARQGSQFVAMQNRQPIYWTVNQVLVSTRIAANDTGYYLILPGMRLKRAQWQDPQIEEDRIASAAATDWYARAMWNAAIGDTDQVRRVLFS